MTPPRIRTHGFALAVSVFALVLIAALIAGVFFAARQEMRLGENVRSTQRAFDAAEAGVHATLAQWDPQAYDTLASGGAAGFSGRLPGGTGSFAGTVLRLNRRLFLIRSTGQDAATVARLSLAALVRLAPAPLAFGAALTVTGPVVVEGASLIEGADQPPAGGDCPPAGPAVAGVMIRDAAEVSSGGCGDGSCIHGEPPVLVAAALGDSVSRAADDAAWRELAARATTIYEAEDGPVTGPRPSGSATACDTAVRDNWGEAAVPPAVPACRAYYPVIYAKGSLRVAGGSGQGVLLVAGDLEIEGGFAFFGPVIVRGKLTVGGGGGRFLGGVMASSAALRPSGVGSAEVAFSRCTLSNALLSRAPAIPLKDRGWAQLY